MRRLTVRFEESALEKVKAAAGLLRGRKGVLSVRIVKVQGSPNPEVKPFLEWAMEEHERAIGAPLHVDWGKDGSLVRGLLGTYGLEGLKRLWGEYLEDDDPWVKRNGVSVGGFKLAVPRYASRKVETRRCPRCNGSGEYGDGTCERCNGTKRVPIC